MKNHTTAATLTFDGKKPLDGKKAFDGNKSLDEQKSTSKRTPLGVLSKVLGHDVVNELAWSCPEAEMIKLFKRNVSRNHLEVGVEGGYSLVKRLKAHPELIVSFLDSNKYSLKSAHKNAKHLAPHLYYAELLQNWNFKNRKFDSININTVIQSLPGSFEDRLSTLFHNARLCLAPKGKLFGSTILGKGESNKISSMLMSMYNKKGVLNNRRDNAKQLRDVLEYYFTDVKVQTVGSMALFEGTMKAGKRDGYAKMVPYVARRERADIRELPVYKIDGSGRKEVKMERRFSF